LIEGIKVILDIDKVSRRQEMKPITKVDQKI